MSQIDELIKILRLDDETKIENLKTIYSHLQMKYLNDFVKLNSEIIDLSKNPDTLLVLRGLYLVWHKKYPDEFDKCIKYMQVNRYLYGK